MEAGPESSNERRKKYNTLKATLSSCITMGINGGFLSI
jgi:hypothetical protein